MSILSAQSIRRLSTNTNQPLIAPFIERGVVAGKSFGLSSCTYDCRIAQDLTLEPLPFPVIVEALFLLEKGFPVGTEIGRIKRLASRVTQTKYKALASTIERFNFPHNVCGSVLDKSSYARVFITAFNTHLDPGWEGWLTVELVNLGDTIVTYRMGDPVCQIKFEWLDEPTDLPYKGKYNNQPDRSVESIHESD